MPISIHRGWDVQLDASNEESDDREGCTVQLNARRMSRVCRSDESDALIVRHACLRSVLHGGRCIACCFCPLR